jgi:Flp pilus assembly protein TadD
MNRIFALAVAFFLVSQQGAMADRSGQFPGIGRLKDWEKAAALNEQAIELRHQGQLTTAIEKAQQGVAIYPHESTLFLTLGNCFFDKKDFKQAEQLYKKAQLLAPKRINQQSN